MIVARSKKTGGRSGGVLKTNKSDAEDANVPMRPPKPDAHPHGAADRRLGRIHDRVIDALSRVEGGLPADRALSEIFKAARDLGSRERHEIGDVVYGVLRERRKIDDLLRRAAKSERRSLDLVDPPLLNRVRVLVFLAMQGEALASLEARDGYATKRLPGVLSRIVKGRVTPSKLTGVEKIGVEHSLPTFIAEALAEAFGEERTAVIGEALSMRAPVTLRVNASRTTREEILARIAEDFDVEASPTTMAPHGIVLSRAIDLYGWEPYKDGLVELQDEGSQLIALALGAKDAKSVLDACAGAGGKSLAIAAESDARIIALDPDAKKLKSLEQRRSRAGAERISAKKGELETLGDEHRGKYDRVLVDAPCTGTGTVRRHPDLKWRLTPSDVTREVARQKHLVTSAAATLRPGGMLVYATCSVLKEENEDVIQHAIVHDARLEPVPLEETLGEALAARLGATFEARIGPGPGPLGPDGFYIALLRRKA